MNALRKMLKLNKTTVERIIAHHGVPAASIPGAHTKKYRYGDILMALGVGLTPEKRKAMFEEEAAEHDKREKRRDIERSLRF